MSSIRVQGSLRLTAGGHRPASSRTRLAGFAALGRLVMGLGFGLGLAIAEPARADIFVVTTTADLVAADGQTSLREAVALANGNGVDDTIVLAPGANYALSLCGAGALLVDGPFNLSIEGEGATLAQACSDQRLLEKTGPNTTTLTLRNLTLVTAPNSGISTPGVAVRAVSRLVLEGVQVNGANAGFNGSVIEVDFGPAPFDLVIAGSAITHSTGTAVSNANPIGVQVTASNLSNNTGAGIAISDGSPLEVVDTVISDNGGTGITTSGQGFGLQPEVSITGSTITGNGGGGFLCLASCRTLVVTDSTISHNGATAVPGRGGGIIMPIVMAGGAVPSVTIIDSTLAGNTADHPGGALYVAGSFPSSAAVQPTVSISRSTFGANQTTCAGCGGGAVAVRLGSLSVIDSAFSANVAAGAGGALQVVRNQSDSITAPAILSLAGVILTGNSAGGDGGGVSVQVDQTTLDRVLFHGNSAGADGGALSAGGVFDSGVVVSGEIDIQHSTFAGNQAQRGGAVRLSFPDGSRVQMRNSTVDGNTAALMGGGFLVGPTERLVLDHVTATRNAASTGANLATSGPTILQRSVIAQPAGSADCATVLGAPPLTVPHLVSAGGNVFGDASCAPGATDLVTAADLALGDLVDNGGATPTRLPSDASPVVGVVALADCTVATDQRGVPRPAGDGCEAGAVEIFGADTGLPFPVTQGDHGDLRLRSRRGSEAIRFTFGTDEVVVTYDADRDDPANPIAARTFTGPFRDLHLRLDGGRDRLQIEGGTLIRDLELSLGQGDDEVVLAGVQVGRRLAVRGGQGRDMVEVSEVRTGDLTIDLGPGDDRLGWIRSRVDGAAQVFAGAGSDRIQLTESTFGGHSLFVGGGGRDQLLIDASTSFARSPRVTGF